MPSPARSCMRCAPAKWRDLGEVPFGRYYGSVDSTPLFVLLAARYFDRTGDEETIRALWPNIQAALAWIDKYGDRDGDGFVEYYRDERKRPGQPGLEGFSQDSIMHADGRLATGPIALCEVQAYVYAAKRGASRQMARIAGRASGGVRCLPTPRKSCASNSKPNSGSRRWASMPSRWMATRSPAGCEPPMPVRC